MIHHNLCACVLFFFFVFFLSCLKHLPHWVIMTELYTALDLTFLVLWIWSLSLEEVSSEFLVFPFLSCSLFLSTLSKLCCAHVVQQGPAHFEANQVFYSFRLVSTVDSAVFWVSNRISFTISLKNYKHFVLSNKKKLVQKRNPLGINQQSSTDCDFVQTKPWRKALTLHSISCYSFWSGELHFPNPCFFFSFYYCGFKLKIPALWLILHFCLEIESLFWAQNNTFIFSFK